MVGGEHSLKISAFKLLLFGIESVWKILNKRITNSVNELINYEIVYRTALATPGVFILLNPEHTNEYFTIPHIKKSLIKAYFENMITDVSLIQSK